jgi:hypothetical protein
VVTGKGDGKIRIVVDFEGNNKEQLEARLS